MINSYGDDLVAEIKPTNHSNSQAKRKKKIVGEPPKSYKVVGALDQLKKDEPHALGDSCQGYVSVKNIHLVSFENTQHPEAITELVQQAQETDTRGRKKKRYASKGSTEDDVVFDVTTPKDFRDFGSLLLFLPSCSDTSQSAEVVALDAPVSYLREVRKNVFTSADHISPAWQNLRSEKVNVRDFSTKKDELGEEETEAPASTTEGSRKKCRFMETPLEKSKRVKEDPPITRAKDILPIPSPVSPPANELLHDKGSTVETPQGKNVDSNTVLSNLDSRAEKIPVIPSSSKETSLEDLDPQADTMALPVVVESTLNDLRTMKNRSNNTISLKEMEKLVLRKLPSASIVAQWAKPNSPRIHQSQAWLSQWRGKLKAFLHEEQLNLSIIFDG